MTLQSSGQITATDIHNEFQSGTIVTTMWEHLGEPLNSNTAPRGIPTGPLAYSDFYGKTSYAFSTIAHTGSFITTSLNNGVSQFRCRDDFTTASSYSSGVTLTVPSHATKTTPSGYTESWNGREVVMEVTYRTLYTPANSMYIYALVPSGYGSTVNLTEWRTWITSGFSGTAAWDTSWQVGVTQYLRGSSFQCDQAGRLWQSSIKFKVQPEQITASSANSGIIMGISESNGVNVNTKFIRLNLT